MYLFVTQDYRFITAPCYRHPTKGFTTVFENNDVCVIMFGLRKGGEYRENHKETFRVFINFSPEKCDPCQKVSQPRVLLQLFPFFLHEFL